MPVFTYYNTYCNTMNTETKKYISINLCFKLNILNTFPMKRSCNDLSLFFKKLFIKCPNKIFL